MSGWLLKDTRPLGLRRTTTKPFCQNTRKHGKRF